MKIINKNLNRILQLKELILLLVLIVNMGQKIMTEIRLLRIKIINLMIISFFIRLFVATKNKIKSKFLKTKEEWSNMDLIEKLTFLWEIPANFFRDITIPPSVKENWSKWRAVLNCVTAPLFFLIFNGSNIILYK